MQYFVEDGKVELIDRKFLLLFQK